MRRRQKKGHPLIRFHFFIADIVLSLRKGDEMPPFPNTEPAVDLIELVVLIDSKR